jgi:hypothetical protein
MRAIGLGSRERNVALALAGAEEQVRRCGMLAPALISRIAAVALLVFGGALAGSAIAAAF